MHNKINAQKPNYMEMMFLFFCDKIMFLLKGSANNNIGRNNNSMLKDSVTGYGTLCTSKKRGCTNTTEI